MFSLDAKFSGKKLRNLEFLCFGFLTFKIIIYVLTLMCFCTYKLLQFVFDLD